MVTVATDESRTVQSAEMAAWVVMLGQPTGNRSTDAVAAAPTTTFRESG
jgi:hypothetical protein